MLYLAAILPFRYYGTDELSRVMIEAEQGINTGKEILTFDPVDRSHSGMYSCRLDNRLGPGVSQLPIDVLCKFQCSKTNLLLQRYTYTYLPRASHSVHYMCIRSRYALSDPLRHYHLILATSSSYALFCVLRLDFF